MPRCRLSVWLIAVFLFAEPVLPVDGPGLGNLDFDPAEVFQPISLIDSSLNQGRATVVNGYLMSIISSSGRGGIEFWNVSDPRNPVLHLRYKNDETKPLREAHALSLARLGNRDLLVAQAFNGIQIWDVTDPDSISLSANLDLPDINDDDYGGAWWTFWQAPYVFVAGVDQGLYVVDASDPFNPVLVNRLGTGELGGVNPGSVFAVGNLLFTMGNQGSGFATFDISDPVHPQLLTAKLDGKNGYTHMFAAGKILTSGGNNDDPTLYAYNVAADGSSIQFIGEGATTCPPPLTEDLGNGGYGSYQDGFFFSGFSNVVAKFDVATQTLIGCGTSGIDATDEDYADVLGNVVWAGNDHHQGSALIPHQAAPDTTGPDVEWVHPPDGADGLLLTTRVGVSMSDSIDLDSVNATTFVVRPVGGQALAGDYSVQMGIANFSPDQPLAIDTTYEVIVNGVQDLVGNPGGNFTSQFTTGSYDPPACTLAALPATQVGVLALISAAGVSGGLPITYSWDFGDGGAPTPPSENDTVSHVYTGPGRYSVLLTVTNDSDTSACSGFITIFDPPTALPPTASGTITHDTQRVYNVNPDNGTVTAVDSTNLVQSWEATIVGKPQTIALAPTGRVWVAVAEPAEVQILDELTGDPVGSIPLPPGSKPYGIVFAPNGQRAYVTLSSVGQLAELDPAASLIALVDAGPVPRGIAVTGDSSRILITRFRSAPITMTDPSDPGTLNLPTGEVREIDATTGETSRLFALHFDAGPDTEMSGRGVPNYINAVRISPDGLRALIPSKKDNVARGTFVDGQPANFESRVRTIVSEIDLVGNAENAAGRIDLNDRALAQSLIFSPYGDLIFVGLLGSDLVEVRDSHTGSVVASLVTGSAPQGMTLDAQKQRLFVHNFLSRSISVFDISGLLGGTNNAIPLIDEVATVDSESLSTEELNGKRIFYSAADSRMSLDGYISCAGCHIDGGHDGQIWDMTQAGEGLRNTIELKGRAGTGHGNVHWTANFDEIQDFENDIRVIFGGSGFLTDTDFSATMDPLGAPKSGLDSDLDALAAYVASLDEMPRSPHRETDGTLTPTAQVGRALFMTVGCSACHMGSQFTDGNRHDVGTIVGNSGLGIGQSLHGVGFETPTLKGLWATAPYLHNGQAATLVDVMENATHVGALASSEKSLLIDYLLQIDDHVDPPLSDDDGDGFYNELDNCPQVNNAGQEDTDNDKQGDACDLDDDNDGLLDIEESTLGTDPLNPDTDGDTVIDGADQYPLDPLQSGLKGDLNGDSVLNISDLLGLQQFLLGLRSLDPGEAWRADTSPVGGEGAINVSDDLELKRLLMAL